MNGKILKVLFVLLVFGSFVSLAYAEKCVQCHKVKTPNIVSDWQLSKHSQNDVDCSTCHGSEHNSLSTVAKAKIPIPETCAQCHDTQVEQFKKGKHAMAWAAMNVMLTCWRA